MISNRLREFTHNIGLDPLEGTNYEIEWTELYGGTVAKSGEELEAVESGLLDMAFVVSPSEPSALPVSNIGYNVPFSSSDPAIVNKAVNAILEKYPELSAEYEKANQKVLAMGVTESYNMISKTPFTKIEELKGKKVGAVGSNLKWVEPTGAALVQSPLPEVYQQLSTGVFEAYVIYPSSAYGYKLYEQAKYYIQTGFGCAIIGALTVNKNTWEKFPEEVQKAILEVASQYSQKLVEENIKLTKESFEKMQQEGAVITELSEEEKAKWVQLVSDVPNQYAQKLNELGLPGTEIVRDYIQAQIDAGHKFPAEYVIN